MGYNEQVLHALLFDVRDYSPELTTRKGVEYYIIEGE